ncbi:hypothetical protein RND71_026420 [Anisodus tanguticus]|uniref:Secreted protein n=1 Tax=Anisodus tanguticus TaxID=243964 RepID=A0AAE1RMA1_9SOLA|nr:hypothetical protein RND71_026420 [Anisodus tanguticus]
MFQFARLSLAFFFADSAAVPKGCPIRESPDLCLFSSSPKHFVDYYALPRLWVPRYPP